MPGGARRGRPRPHPRREPRQPARAPRAAPRSVGDRAGLRRRRRSGRHSPGPPPRTGLPPAGWRPCPRTSRRLLLVAAAEPVGDVPLFWRAVQRLGIPPEAAGAAEAAGLIELRDRARFRHPLVRSAVYRSATPAERREVHRALADATDPAVDPDRRAWHQACAALHPDEAVATELERVGEARSRPRRRGGRGGVPRAVRRADARPGPPRAARARQRAVQGARRARSTTPRRCWRPLRRRRSTTPRGPALDLVRAEISFATNRGNDALPLLLAAAARLEPLDAGLARDTYLDALRAALFAGRLASGPGVRAGGRSRAQGGRHLSHPARATPCCDGLAVLFTDGYAPAAPAARTARCRRSPRGADPGRGPALQLARRRHGGVAVGRRLLGRPQPQAPGGRPDARARSARSPWPSTPAASCSCSPVTWRPPRRSVDETRVRHGDDGEHPGALRRDRPRRPARSRGAGRTVDPELSRATPSPAGKASG